LNANIRIKQKSNTNWLFSMQCIDIYAACETAQLAKSFMEKLGYRIERYTITPPTATRGGKRHALEFYLSSDDSKQTTRLALARAIPALGERAGHTKPAQPPEPPTDPS
jgi:hypothetical protein